MYLLGLVYTLLFRGIYTMSQKSSRHDNHHLLLVLWRQQAYSRNQPVYGNETWHTDRVLKPHVHRHTIITPTSFAAPTRALNPTRVGKFGDFQPTHRRLTVSTKRCEIGPLFINRIKSYINFPLVT